MMDWLLLFLPLLLSRFISYFYPLDRDWLNSFQQSPLTPPNYFFPLVWTFMYLLIGWGLSEPNGNWLVFNLMLNYLWIIMFNGFKNIKAAFWILLLICLTLVMYLDQSKNWVLLPYLIWSLFALYLNAYLLTTNEIDH